jgi:hypothetical protein
MKHKYQERIRHLLNPAIADKLISHANTAYDVNPESYHRLLKITSGLLPHSSVTSNLHEVTRPDTKKLQNLPMMS